MVPLSDFLCSLFFQCVDSKLIYLRFLCLNLLGKNPPNLGILEGNDEEQQTDQLDHCFTDAT